MKHKYTGCELYSEELDLDYFDIYWSAEMHALYASQEYALLLWKVQRFSGVSPLQAKVLRQSFRNYPLAQLSCLGNSQMQELYEMKTEEEAQGYLADALQYTGCGDWIVGANFVPGVSVATKNGYEARLSSVCNPSDVYLLTQSHDIKEAVIQYNRGGQNICIKSEEVWPGFCSLGKIPYAEWDTCITVPLYRGDPWDERCALTNYYSATKLIQEHTC